MEQKDYTRAKEMFCGYMCSYFFMFRDGVHEKYKAFDVPKELEVRWTKEYEEGLLEKLLAEKNRENIVEIYNKYGMAVALLHDKKAMLFMLEYTNEHFEQLDAWTIYGFVSINLNTMKPFGMLLRRKVIAATILILKRMLDKPIEIAEEYKENGVLPDYISEERIVNESTELLEDLEHDLKTLRY